MTSADQDMFECAPPINRLAFRNLFIYDSNHRDTALGGLWVAEGITNTNLYSMVEIICIFTDTFVLEDENQRLVEKDEQPLQPGNYYIASDGKSPLRFGHRSPLTHYPLDCQVKFPIWDP